MSISIHWMGQVDYAATYTAMRDYTRLRQYVSTDTRSNQLWICEHPAVFTQGISGKAEHIFNAGAIPVVQTDRGGQVTFHGPGQVVAYPLINLVQLGYFVKEYVYRLEEAAIKTLLHFGITGHRVAGAPGIYVRLEDPCGHAALTQRAPCFDGLGKISALGIKVSRHCTYHGVALNVAMDLSPFSRINPCGYATLQTIDMASFGLTASLADVAEVLAQKLQRFLTP